MKLRKFSVAAGLGLAAMGHAQIPDLLTAFDVGGRPLGLGGALSGTGTSTRSILDNPAGIGFTSAPTVGIALRNLSGSNTRVSDDFDNPDFRTEGDAGDRALTHFGYATPIGKLGVLGISYQLGGYIRDVRTGTNLRDGELTVRDYRETLLAKTNFFTFALARARADFSSAWGVGLVFANQDIRNTQRYRLFRADNTEIAVTPLDNRGSSTGIGLVAGVQLNPGGKSNSTIGLSARTPISLNEGGEIDGYYPTIPGKLSASYAQRFTSPRNAEEFYILALQFDAYFGGDENAVLSRDGFQLVGGAGIEYHLRFRNAYIPLRLGYRSMSRGGDGFLQVSGLSFGLGYNPVGSNFNVDLDFLMNSAGSMDMSLALTYRIKK